MEKARVEVRRVGFTPVEINIKLKIQTPKELDNLKYDIYVGALGERGLQMRSKILNSAVTDLHDELMNL